MKQIAVILASSLALTGQVLAADLSSEVVETPTVDRENFDERWEASVFSYGWLASMDGSSGLSGFPAIDFSISFEEFFNHIDWYFAVFGELRYGRFGIATDIFYSDVSDDVSGSRGLGAAMATSQLFTATVMGEYRIWEQQTSSLDIMAGARFWNLDNAVDVTIGDGDIFPDGVKLRDSESWTDPMIGAKARLQGDTPFYISGWAMIGGFGAAAKIDWDVFGGVGYEFNKNMSILAGYRAFGVDYETDDFIFNVIQHGPMIGSVFKF